MNNLFKSIKESLGISGEPVILKVIDIDYNGSKRIQFNVRKPRGKKVYRVVMYDNGMLSSAV